MIAAAVSTNVLLSAAGAVALVVGLLVLAWQRMPSMRWPLSGEVSPEKRFLTDLGLVLDLQARLVESGNIPAAKLCDQIKLEMLKAPVPPRDPPPTLPIPQRQKL